MFTTALQRCILNCIYLPYYHSNTQKFYLTYSTAYGIINMTFYVGITVFMED